MQQRFTVHCLLPLALLAAPTYGRSKHIKQNVIKHTNFHDGELLSVNNTCYQWCLMCVKQASVPQSENDVFIEKAVPKSYSLPPTLHQKLTSEAQRRSAIEGRRVSASQVLLEILREKNFQSDVAES